MKITSVLSREEIRSLTKRSDALGALEVLADILLIGGTFALAAFVPHWSTYLFAIIMLGGRQLGLAIIVHECAHRSLFETRWLNTFFGRIGAALIWNRLPEYRVEHLKHHNHAGTEEDPDRGLVAGFPVGGKSLGRKFFRDLTGLAALRRIVGLLMMDLGLLTFSAGVNTERVEEKPGLGTMLMNLVRNTGPVVLANGALFLILYACGHPSLFALWGIAWMTTFGLFMRVRSIGEHSCLPRSPEVLQNTRTIDANPIARALVAPHFVNLHLEHHLLPSVPCYRLRRFRRLLLERNAVESAPYQPGYFAMLRQAATRTASV